MPFKKRKSTQKMDKKETQSTSQIKSVTVSTYCVFIVIIVNSNSNEDTRGAQKCVNELPLLVYGLPFEL